MIGSPSNRWTRQSWLNSRGITNLSSWFSPSLSKQTVLSQPSNSSNLTGGPAKASQNLSQLLLQYSRMMSPVQNGGTVLLVVGPPLAQVTPSSILLFWQRREYLWSMLSWNIQTRPRALSLLPRYSTQWYPWQMPWMRRRQNYLCQVQTIMYSPTDMWMQAHLPIRNTNQWLWCFIIMNTLMEANALWILVHKWL